MFVRVYAVANITIVYVGDRYLVPLCSPGTAAVYAYIYILVHGSNLNLSCDNGVAITFQIDTKNLARVTRRALPSPAIFHAHACHPRGKIRLACETKFPLLL